MEKQSRHKRRYWKRKNAGLCTSCGVNPSHEGKSWCQGCLSKGAECRRKAKDKKIKNGICVHNGCNEPSTKTQRCDRHQEEQNLRSFKRNLAIKKETFEAYGGAKCSCCGDDEIWVLCLDHIGGDGSSHRQQLRSIGKDAGGHGFYRMLKSQGFPDKDRYRVLCCNCNLYIHLRGEPCYHQQS